MLVLGRKEGEEVVIDGPVTVRVVAIVGSYKVKLGFTASDDVTILRRELLDGEARPSLEDERRNDDAGDR
jgi:carbon storage regulator CsrA